eukprot:SAG11_NODE_632_length_8057_cov_6.472481_5_plen_59_part_00
MLTKYVRLTIDQSTCQSGPEYGCYLDYVSAQQLFTVRWFVFCFVVKTNALLSGNAFSR